MDEKNRDKEAEAAHNMIVAFAENNKAKISAVYRGPPLHGEGPKWYYFVAVSSDYDYALENAVSRLDMKVARETTHECEMSVWPSKCTREKPSFLETLIWEKPKDDDAKPQQ